MFPNALRDGRVVGATLLVVSTFVLGVQLLNPPELVVATSGHDATVGTVGYYFPYQNAVIVAIAASTFGATTTFLVLETRYASSDTADDSTVTADDADPAAQRRNWEETAAELSATERVVYETALKAGGKIPQRDIVEQTDLSKATVSRTLGTLESRDLLARERRGMGNVVVLQ
ncbi:helix-turn-helix transcriptional regulator [Natronobacterium gregoryi]|uniref:MarR family transcriptional regulator n=2 Tax=Natronobacterium gregoryi TaxID=44930 RepID=L0AMU6_NATGS|nr:MarR family transcriptional regulator [Natronobacterium gregoryi]AFZ74522.1 hypothetical protein Natgr_3402 [Natronobacterium gregoryi SP2]ELY72404.1 hypothetical protein C490_03633 [Natronobacterium gregoryi SP2]PLK21732.1 MarR family transcriptional regulator [Natronobacterium gregoryi SP2]SFI97551.1 IclR helix-turn-helix domain-containing protein [Natronobacterium gregoryi]